ncbi:MAG: molybdenum cofactor guanylyltransferase [Deltaproteobacteria bacterium]|nr:molybdenum cofactor guanylyltransferase [Deltaproteobacteria bacterium]
MTEPDPGPSREASCEPVEPGPAGPRIRRPGLLLLGAAGRNAGKTTLSCRVLRRLADRFALTGVKVTTVGPGAEHECPRGGEGCGVCRSFGGPFLLTDERDGPPGKDTTRMLEAGARRVLWLRVHRHALHAGAEALLKALGPHEPVVAESNMLRTVLDPDLFLMLRRTDTSAFKATAREVHGFADRTVRFDGAGHDLDLGTLDLVDGRWRLDEPPTAIVLAGGTSRRMGADKRALAVGGVPLLQRVVDSLRPHAREVLVGTSPALASDDLPGTRTVFDRVPGQGPLMGLASCLAASSSDRNLVAACDLPEIPPGLVERLLSEALSGDVAVPRAANGNIEPLLAVYRRRLLPDIERLLAAGERSIRPLLAERDTRWVPLEEFGGSSVLPNLNTPEDLRNWVARRGGAAPGTPDGTR